MGHLGLSQGLGCSGVGLHFGEEASAIFLLGDGAHARQLLLHGQRADHLGLLGVLLERELGAGVLWHPEQVFIGEKGVGVGVGGFGGVGAGQRGPVGPGGECAGGIHGTLAGDRGLASPPVHQRLGGGWRWSRGVGQGRALEGAATPAEADLGRIGTGDGGSSRGLGEGHAADARLNRNHHGDGEEKVKSGEWRVERWRGEKWRESKVIKVKEGVVVDNKAGELLDCRTLAGPRQTSRRDQRGPKGRSDSPNRGDVSAGEGRIGSTWRVPCGLICPSEVE